MDDQYSTTFSQIDTSSLLLLVVGAHLRAEFADRPLAYRLCNEITDWLMRHKDDIHTQILPVMCCDVWYLNHEPLQHRPTISIGGPGVNALSAYYHNNLNAALVRDEKLIIQLDPEFIDLRVSLWGMDHALTASALDLFETKYLDSYLRAVVTQVEPDHD